MRNFFNFLGSIIMLIYDRIKQLCKDNGVTVTGTEAALGFARGSLCKIDKNKPSIEKVSKLADYLHTTSNYIMTGEDSSVKAESLLSERDERDIAKRLESTLNALEFSQESLMFSGEPLDDETRELLKASLENSLKIAKINAKQKFTPKKYRPDNE